MSNQGYFAVVGSREWSSPLTVKKIVSQVLAEGFGVGSGGALGADLFALQAVIFAGVNACNRSVVRLPRSISDQPKACQGALWRFHALGGTVIEGEGMAYVPALFDRTRRLVAGSVGVIAFFQGESKGTLFTCQCAIIQGKPLIVFPENGKIDSLPPLGPGTFIAFPGLQGAYQFIPKSVDDDVNFALSELGKIFDHSEYGEGFEGMARHVSAVPQADRMLFEDFTLDGDKILAPHENRSDLPFYLTLEYLRKRFQSVPLESLTSLRDNLITIDASKEVCDYYFSQTESRNFEEVAAEVAFFAAELEKLSPTIEKEGDNVSVEEDVPWSDLPPNFNPAGIIGILDAYAPYPFTPDDVKDEDEDGEEHTESFSTIGMHIIDSIYQSEEPTTWEDLQPEGFLTLWEETKSHPYEGLSGIPKKIYASHFSNSQKSVLFDAYRIRKLFLFNRGKHIHDLRSASLPPLQNPANLLSPIISNSLPSFVKTQSVRCYPLPVQPEGSSPAMSMACAGFYLKFLFILQSCRFGRKLLPNC